VVDRAGSVSAVSDARAIGFDTVAPAAPVLDFLVVGDGGFLGGDVVGVITCGLSIANTAGEPAFGYLHELSPNGRSSTGGAYDAKIGRAACREREATYAVSGGGRGSDGRKGVWSDTAWVVERAGNVSAV